MRVLALADEQPPGDAAELVAQARVDAVLTLSDLPADWLDGRSFAGFDRLGATEVMWVRGALTVELER